MGIFQQVQHEEVGIFQPVEVGMFHMFQPVEVGILQQDDDWVAFSSTDS